MKKFIAPALLALVAMCSQVYAQSSAGSDTNTSSAGSRSSAGEQSGSASSDRSSGQSSTSGATGSATAGQTSRTGATNRSQGSQAGQSGAQAQGSPIDQHIAVCLTLGNQEEIALSQFGQDRAQNPQVKQFAQMMVQEHQQAISQLQQAAPQLASMNLELTAEGAGASSAASGTGESGVGARPGAGSASGLTGTNEAGSASASQRASAGGSPTGQGGQQELVDFARDAKQQCLSLSMQELGRKQGAEFDKAFMGQQIALHTGMLAHLRAAQQHSQNDQLKPIIQQGAQMTEHHLAQARQIMEQLDASNGAEGATRQGAATPAVPRR